MSSTDIRAGRPVRVARFPPSLGHNPYLDLLYGGMTPFGVDLACEPPFSLAWLWRARHDVDLLHFHWRPDHYYARCRFGHDRRGRLWAPSQELGSWVRLLTFAGRLAAARLLGYRVAWTIHEVYPPETPSRPPGAISRRVDRVGSRLLARASRVLLAHDAATARHARVEFGRAVADVRVVPHPSFLEVYPAGRGRSEVREELALAEDTFTFLCFGKLRPDKEVGLLLEAFRSLPSVRVALVVAGKPEDPHSQRRLEDEAAADARLRLRLDLVPHEHVRELFDACDVAVFPRSEPWTSGSLILALSLGVPAVSACISPYDELLGSGRAGWLFEPGNSESLRDALAEASADVSTARRKGVAALEQARALPTWEEAAARTAELIRNAFATRNGHGGRRTG